MKRERPPMPPLSVRVKVAERQFRDRAPFDEIPKLVLKARLAWLTHVLFLEDEYALDHDPALILRDYNPAVVDVASRYTPHAHDPNHLIYREKADHQQKTTGRKPGAERTVTTKGSDVWLKSKFNRLEGRTKQRPKQKIQSRGFQKRKPAVDKFR